MWNREPVNPHPPPLPKDGSCVRSTGWFPAVSAPTPHPRHPPPPKIHRSLLITFYPPRRKKKTKSNTGNHICNRCGTVYETEYVSTKTNTGCLPLKEILAGSKQDTLKWKTKRGASLEGAFCSLFTHINETQTAADTSLFNVLGNTSALVPCGQKKGWFWCWKPSAPFLLSCQEHLSALPQFCLINQLCRPVGLPAWRLPYQITQELWRKKKENSHAMPRLFVPSSLSDPCFVLN